MNQDLLPVSLRLLLPRLGSERSLAEPMVYAHYPMVSRNYYVQDPDWAPEGALVGADYGFFGLLLASGHHRDWNSRSLRLSSLEETVS